MDRNGFSLRRKTTQAQKLPADYIPKLVAFVIHVRQMRLAVEYPLSSIYACDETPVWVEVDTPTTIERTGSSEVSVRTFGGGKTRVSVMLTARADGKKLKPMVVLKRKKPLPELEQEFRRDLLISYQSKGWFDQKMTETFLERQIGQSMFGERRLLVWDSYSCHISHTTKSKMAKMKIDSAVVPGGTTRYIQAPDVSWNKSFKSKYSQYYDEWTHTGERQFTSGGNPKPPCWQLVCSWIRDAWKEIPEAQIKESFKHCGVSSATDGSEDDEIVCFKPGHVCAAGREILQEKSAQLLTTLDLEQFEDAEYSEDNPDPEEEEENEIVIFNAVGL